MTTTLSSGYRRYALILFIGINLLNYIDRQVLYAVFPLIKSSLQISDTSLGLLGSAFMVVYMCAAPIFGWLGDRGSRVRLAAGGLGIWSLATMLAGVATGYNQLLGARSLVGVGEASYGTVAPGILSDYFPQEKRGRILSWFYLAIPVGSALGYLLGGVIGERFGWQSAFLMVGAPGLLLVLPLALLKTVPMPKIERRVSGGYASFLKNRSFVLNTLAMTAMTFAMGGMAQWMPTFLHRVHGLGVERGNLLFGGLTVVAGIIGTLAGGWLGDYFQRRRPDGYLLVSGWGFICGIPATMVALTAADLTTALAGMFLAELCLFLNTGPLNTVIVNVTRHDMRAMAFAANIFVIHALGDAISPAFIGFLSDHWGLERALLSTVAAILLAAVFCFLCGRRIAEDLVVDEPSLS
ncbi:MAG: rane protein, major facilitator superfamily [Deltaproteobacteria bacterium]|nr:rane protein, major facilitator superfamily [Deltaproteobacteria bacterium]